MNFDFLNNINIAPVEKEPTTKKSNGRVPMQRNPES
jgi:hypothetical protein